MEMAEWPNLKEIARRAAEDAMNSLIFTLEDGREFSLREFADYVASGEIVPVRHGRWIEETDRSYHWHCSECLTVQGVSSIRMNYCPECGALMEMHPLVAATANSGP